MVTLPNGQRTYIGRRGRLPAGYGDTPPPPSAVPMSAVVKRILQASPLTLPAAVPLRALSSAGSAQLSLFPGFVVGWSISETSGSAACLVRLYDADSASGQLLAVIGLAEGTGSQVTMPAPGWGTETGLYLDVVSGSFDGVIWYLPTANEGAVIAAPPLTNTAPNAI